jgi:diguanylate cyclase (GGDEF)-like protein/PAS domain S-box-containing protein
VDGHSSPKNPLVNTDAPESLAHKYNDIVERSPESITMISRDYVYVIANDSYCRTIGKPRAEIVGKTVEEIWGRERFETAIKQHLDTCFGGESVSYEERFGIGPSEKVMHVSFYPHEDNGRITHALVFSTDTTQIRALETRLKEYQFKDPTTGLLNRRSLSVLLQNELDKASRSKSERSRAVLLISLGDLARVNQSYGHHIGDILMENSGLRIKESLRKADLVFHFEGNDLAAILTNIARATDVAKVAEKLVSHIGVPYHHANGDLILSATVGVAVYPTDGTEVDELVQNAYSAMREAKKRNLDYLLFNPELHEQAKRRLQLEGDMRRALGEGGMHLVYQPIVDVEGRLRGCEALMRWNHPKNGAVSPNEFIPIAEESGLINIVGKWTLFEACKTAKLLAPYGVYVSINVSAHEFSRAGLMEDIERTIKATGVKPGSIRLEITETTSMDNPDRAMSRMRDLRSMGLETVIDDFGTGYSSLSYLKELPVDTLKIDKAFVDGIVEDVDDRTFFESIVNMAKSRHKKLVVEGVESSEQVAIVSECGGDFIQGFYFAQPMPAEDIVQIAATETVLPRS